MPADLIPFSKKQPLATETEGEPDIVSRQELEQICLALIHLRESGDLTTLAAYMTEDCEMDLPGLPGLAPFAGRIKGRQECLNAIQSNFTAIEPFDMRAESIVLDGECAVIAYTSKIRNRGSGPLMEFRGVARLRFRGRQFCYYANHFDTAVVAALTNGENGN